MNHHARYSIHRSSPEQLTIADTGHGYGCMTVTNDAETVVEELHASGLLGTRRLYYYDSDGQLDELLHDGRGKFTGFAPGPGRK